MCNCDHVVKAFAAIAALVATASASAEDGKVLPAYAAPYGFTLLEMAELTAVYNTGVSSENPSTPAPPDVPFQILVADATVNSDTILYVPVYYADDSGGAPSGFPKDVFDQCEDEDFLLSYVLANYQVSAFIVQVDGKTAILGADSISGVRTAPLLDGTPPGTHYITSAAFISPLTKGKHTVGIGGMVDGKPVVFASYTVSVR